MQRCDLLFAAQSTQFLIGRLNPTYPGCSAVINRTLTHQTTQQHGLNPTYPGCSAVIRNSRKVRGGRLKDGLNPTYPGCSAVIRTRNVRHPRERRPVLILLTLDAAL